VAAAHPQAGGGTAGKVHDANRAVPRVWKPGWTDVQDRGYVSFTRLAQILAKGMITDFHKSCVRLCARIKLEELAK